MTPMEKRDKYLTLVEHLDELRARVIKSFAVFFLTALFVYSCIDQILYFLLKPIGPLVFLSPSDAFLAVMTLIIFGGLTLAMPYILYQIWQFISVALTEAERKYTVIFLPLSIVFFISGVIFAYVGVLPISLKFFLSFSSEFVRPMITIDRYISFVTTLTLSFGFVFELLLLIAFLTKIGFLTPAFLTEKRRHAIVAIFIMSAILTPPDCISQIFMALPLMALYEFSILLSRQIYRANIHMIEVGLNRS